MQFIEPQDYEFHTQPFNHQRDIFHLSRDMEVFAILAEQGTGKSKIVIDTIAWLFQTEQIDAVLGIAPNGVQFNWHINELPTHMPPRIDYRSAVWRANPRAAEKKALLSLWDDKFKGLDILLMHVEAFSRQKGVQFARKFVTGRRVLMFVDESTRIKTPGAKRTRSIISLGKHTRYRRILTGTFITNRPTDAYAQFRFLNPGIIGQDNFEAFKHHYCNMETGFNKKTRQEYKTIVGYRNIDELKAKIAPFSTRVRKKDCLDLPEKVYERRYIEMTAEQRKIYNDLAESIKTYIREHKVTANIALTKLLRLQQVLGGQVPRDDGTMIPVSTNRPDALMGILEEVDLEEDKVIIWSRFKHEVRQLHSMITEEYGSGYAAMYHGDIKQDERNALVTMFQNDALPRVFIGTPQSGGIGITLHAASHVIYYSNDFSLETRLQSEDRAHRIGQCKSVTYYDIECIGSMDTRIINALRDKRDIASTVLDDPIEEWI